MTPKQISLVQASFARVVPIAATAASLFYSRLFELDPSLRPMFKSDMKEQGRKLISTIGLIVRGLQKPETILPKVGELGRKHVSYGVLPEHYDTVGEALLWTLAKGLGEDFTPDVEDAWVKAYNLLATTMQDAAYEMAPRPLVAISA